MRNSFSRVAGSAVSVVLAFHFIGAALAFLVFSYQYARQHGILSWFLFGEIVPALKALVWEVFVAISLFQSPQPAQVTFWWHGGWSIDRFVALGGWPIHS